MARTRFVTGEEIRWHLHNGMTLMAMAADCTVFETEEIVPAGEIGPDHVGTPHILVDYVLRI